MIYLMQISSNSLKNIDLCLWIVILIAKNPFFEPKRFFWKKPFSPLFRGPLPPHLHKKSEKSNEAILHKVQKTLFLGRFLPKFAPKNFLSKIGLRHILGITILHHCAKNQKKLMSHSREKLVTDERTNERTDGRTDGRTDEHRLI